MRREADLTSAKTVLLMRNEGAIGDVVVDSALVKCLHKAGMTVDFLLTKSNSQVMRDNPHIRHIYEAENVDSAAYLRKFTHNVPQSVINELANNKYDIVIDPSLFDIPVHRMLLLRQIKARSVLGFNKWPSINHYTRSFDFDCANWHVSKTFTLIADYLQLDKNICSLMTCIFPRMSSTRCVIIWRLKVDEIWSLIFLPAIRTAACRRSSWPRFSPDCAKSIPLSILYCSTTAMKFVFLCRRRSA